MNIDIKKLHKNAKIPVYQTADSAGADLHACIENDMIIADGKVAMVPTGLAAAVPKGYEMQIRARSGLASKGLILPNAPGTIDADYRGEIKVLMLNLSGADFTITPDMRIAQAVIAPIIQAEYKSVEELSSTERGSGGFGSTGG